MDLENISPRLELKGISKSYGSVRANKDISLKIMPGEIHAVLGENGAGKSTLMKIIYGSVMPDGGDIFIDGKQANIKNPNNARALGIGMVFQHFNLFDSLTAAENVLLGLSKNTKANEASAELERISEAYGLEVDPMRPVHSLSVGERQRLEIVRALMTHPKILILDEPTSVLTPQAVQRLFETLKKLSAEGCSIVYISHKLHEIRNICTACTVMRAGEVVGFCNPQNESDASLSAMMLGHEPPVLEHHERSAGEIIFELRQMTCPKQNEYGVDLTDINLELRQGEVLGIAGVSGNGQSELLSLISGEYTNNICKNTIFIDSKDVSGQNISKRRQVGLCFVPEERLGRGAAAGTSLANNMLLTRNEALGFAGWIKTKILKKQTEEILQKFDVKASGINALASSLSGGNLQKFIMGREIDAKPRIFIVAQPTWGVDVGAAANIRAQILKLRDEGCAVLVISEELDELFELSDRIQVIAKGKLSPSIVRKEASIEQIGQWLSGLWNAGVQEHLRDMENQEPSEHIDKIKKEAENVFA